MDEQVMLVLLGISGVAATFAGFSGVVGVFDRRAQGDWFPEESLRLSNMLVVSLGACLFSLVPLVEYFLHVPDPALWTWASVLLAGFCGVYFFHALRHWSRVRRLRHTAVSAPASAVVILSMSLAIVLQVLNAGGLLFERGAGLYTAGLWLLLIVAGVQFGFLVLVPLAPADRRQGQ